jgi:O-antigen/teichoic acid export membrane protein
VLILASHLGPKLFGHFVLVQTTALLFTTFCALSLGQMATKIVAESLVAGTVEQGRTMSVSYGVALMGSALCGLAMVLLARVLAVSAAGDSHLTVAFALSSLLVLTGFLSSVQAGVALGLGAMKPFAIGNFIAAPLSVGVLAVSAQWRDVTVALVGYVVSQTVVVVAQEIAIRRALVARGIVRSFRNLRRTDWEVVWTLGLPSSLAGAFTLPSMWLVLVMLAHVTNGAVEVGKFGIANQFRSLMILGVGAVANAALPGLATARALGDPAREERTAVHAFAMVLVVTIVPAAVLFIFGRPLLALIGPSYPEAIVELRLLAASTVATALTAIYMRMATARGEARWLIYSNAAFAFALVAVALFAVRDGSVGVSWAILIASVCQLVTIALGQDSRFRAR